MRELLKSIAGLELSMDEIKALDKGLDIKCIEMLNGA